MALIVAWQATALVPHPSLGDRRTIWSRRAATSLLGAGAGSGFSWSNLFPSGLINAASAAVKPGSTGATNEVISVVEGIKQKRLGYSDIIVSEIGLGTQRWGSSDFNGPDESLCHKMMNRAILESGVNLIDTAEQYPIPSDRARPEGGTERIIGSWLAQDKTRRQKVRANRALCDRRVQPPRRRAQRHRCARRAVSSVQRP